MLFPSRTKKSKLDILRFEIEYYYGRIVDFFRLFRPSHVAYRLKLLYIFGKYALTSFDWDWYYFAKLICLKLELMEKHFLNDAHSNDAPKNAEQMKECRFALQRLIDDEYISTELDEYHTAYPHTTIEHEDGSVEWVSHPKANRASILALYKKEDSLKRQDLMLFSKILRQHLLDWWD